MQINIIIVCLSIHSINMSIRLAHCLACKLAALPTFEHSASADAALPSFPPYLVSAYSTVLL